MTYVTNMHLTWNRPNSKVANILCLEKMFQFTLVYISCHSTDSFITLAELIIHINFIYLKICSKHFY